MKKKIDKKIIAIILLLFILIGINLIYLLSNSDDSEQEEYQINKSIINNEYNKTNTISTTGEIKSALSENLELHATYYLEEMYVENNKYVKQGEKILKYTNGTYLLAPYNCVINKTNIPEVEGKCTKEHYVTVEATNVVQMSIKVDEENISNISIGAEAELYVNALEKTYVGYITKISSTASNGKFTITMEFENDGDIKIGMTGKCSIDMV